jgi:hypothetical protein
MRQTLIYIVFLASNCLLAQTSEQDKVNACFQEYKSAILEDRGADAAEVVNKTTIEYYEKMLDIALYADSATVDGLGITDKVTVFTIRHKIPKSEVSELDGKDFFIYAINTGMVGKNTVVNMNIGTIDVNDNFATGQLVASGQESPMFFQFQKEDGWKLDITSLFPASNTVLNQMVANSGMNQNDFLFQIMQSLTGRYPDESIWQPMK